MIVSRFIGLTETDAESIDLDIEQWLDSLAVEPGSQFSGQMYHPGWSPVAYDPPRRALRNVRRVYALVLDHDAGGDWDALCALWAGSAGVVYTTKSHAADAAHYRVVLALARPVSAEEYATLWQWAARRSAEADIAVDQQCKDASRFWYDPSVPPGGWRSQRLAGAAIDPDGILAAAAPPRLQVVRPVHAPDTSERMRRARAYLARIPGAVSGQQGHTVTFNAVAHVMIGFDLTSDDTLSLIAEEYNPRCSPAWSERELRHKIDSVAKRCTRDRGYLLTDRPRIESTRTAASHAPAAPDLDVDWTSRLLVDAKRNTRRAYHNTAVFVRHYPEFRGHWSMDLMTSTPWFHGVPMDPSMVHHIRATADQRLGYTPPAGDVEAAIIASARDRPFHPILQYLRSLDWDGTPRLASMARDYFGLEDPIYAEMVRKFMIGAAARALWPGCKLDTALMLVGEQGFRKSTFFAVLGGQWHADSHIDITNKDGAMQLHRAWIYELSELENVVTGARESRLKAWMSSSHDLYRAPYAKVTERKPRAVVVCGTTNRRQFLTDDTGSRRFWILPVQREIPFQLLAELRDQLWAEAVCAAESGEPWWLEREHESVREEANRDFHEDDSWADLIGEWLSSPLIDRITVGELLTNALKIDVGKHDRSAQMRVARILTQLGWKRKQFRCQGGRVWRYCR